jgi:hypothetical protein
MRSHPASRTRPRSPNPDPQLSLPVHQVALVINGVHLLENLKLDELVGRNSRSSWRRSKSVAPPARRFPQSRCVVHYRMVGRGRGAAAIFCILPRQQLSLTAPCPPLLSAFPVINDQLSEHGGGSCMRDTSGFLLTLLQREVSCRCLGRSESHVPVNAYQCRAQVFLDRFESGYHLFK